MPTSSVALIRPHGRATSARARVLDLLLAAPHALSHADIKESLSGRSQIDRVTLYRVLDWLVSNGLAHKPIVIRSYLRSSRSFADQQLFPGLMRNAMTRLRSLLISLPLACTPALGLAAEAHVHGQANLDVAVDGATLTLILESPTDSLAGFEHAPSSDEEHAAVARMRETLEQAERLFVPTPAAQCTLASVKLHSLLLGDTPEPGHEGHADLDGVFALQCAHPEQLHDLEVRLFDAFPGLKRINCAVVAPQGQTAAQLTPDGNRIAW